MRLTVVPVAHSHGASVRSCLRLFDPFAPGRIHSDLASLAYARGGLVVAAERSGAFGSVCEKCGGLTWTYVVDFFECF